MQIIIEFPDISSQGSSCRLTTALSADGSDRRDKGTAVGGGSFQSEALPLLEQWQFQPDSAPTESPGLYLRCASEEQRKAIMLALGWTEAKPMCRTEERIRAAFEAFLDSYVAGDEADWRLKQRFCLLCEDVVRIIAQESA